jgi:fucose permease
LYSYFGIAAVIFVTTSLLTWFPTYIEKTRGVPPDKAGQMASIVMMMAMIGAPLGGILTDRWRKTKESARLLFPAVSTLVSAILLFISLIFLTGTIQYVLLLVFGTTVLMFISGAAAVTQDVIHPGLRATSYAIAVVIQNLLGASTAPVILGSIYDKTDIQTAVMVLPFVLVLGSVLFWLGSKKYVGDMNKVAKIQLVAI